MELFSEKTDRPWSLKCVVRIAWCLVAPSYSGTTLELTRLIRIYCGALGLTGWSTMLVCVACGLCQLLPWLWRWMDCKSPHWMNCQLSIKQLNDRISVKFGEFSQCSTQPGKWSVFRCIQCLSEVTLPVNACFDCAKTSWSWNATGNHCWYPFHCVVVL